MFPGSLDSLPAFCGHSVIPSSPSWLGGSALLNSIDRDQRSLDAFKSIVRLFHRGLQRDRGCKDFLRPESLRDRVDFLNTRPKIPAYRKQRLNPFALLAYSRFASRAMLPYRDLYPRSSANHDETSSAPRYGDISTKWSPGIDPGRSLPVDRNMHTWRSMPTF